MNIKELFIGFVTVFVVTLVVAAIVSYLWSLIAHGVGAFDWETSFRFAVIFGIIFSWMDARERKKKGKLKNRDTSYFLR